jgi:hypothetical protein
MSTEEQNSTPRFSSSDEPECKDAGANNEESSDNEKPEDISPSDKPDEKADSSVVLDTTSTTSEV